jgi:hypothetical protein
MDQDLIRLTDEWHGLDLESFSTEELEQLQNSLRTHVDRISSILRVRLYPKQGHYV